MKQRCSKDSNVSEDLPGCFLLDSPDDSLSALVNRDVLHGDLLLAASPVSFQRLHLHRECPGLLNARSALSCC
jgi:hypothetical protein